MARLPTPGSDENTWGHVLNDFLAQSHNPDGSLRGSAVAATNTSVLLTGDQTVAGTKTFSNPPAVPNDSFTIAKIQGLAAALAEKADESQVSGYELAIAQKSDALFTTNSTTPVAVPGLSITVIVPDRPYVVRVETAGVMSQANVIGNIDIRLSDGSRVGAAPATQSGPSSDSLRTFFTETRIPNAIHAPAPGTTVTYEVRAWTGDASSNFIVVSGPFFGDNIATLVAVAQ